MQAVEKKIVSVIIPTYKRPDKLEIALNSVLNQTYSYIEIIIVDDNNSNTPERRSTESLLQKYDQNSIVYIKNEKNLGASFSRNIGVNFSKGYYIAFLDDDDEWRNNKIELQVKKFQNSNVPNLGLVYCNVIRKRHEISQGKLTNFTFSGNDIRDFILNHSGISNSLILMKKEIFYEIGGFIKVDMAQDFFLNLDILNAGYSFDLCKEPLVIYKLGSDLRISRINRTPKNIYDKFNRIKKYYITYNFFDLFSMNSKLYLELAISFTYNGKYLKSVISMIFSLLLNPKSITIEKIKLIMSSLCGSIISKIMKKDYH